MNEFNAKTLITETVTKSFKSRLKESGFKKSGLNWLKETNDINTVINIQFGRNHMKHDSSFTVNLSFYHELFHMNRGLPMPKNKISEIDCDIRIRIGQLMGMNDYWWSIAHNKDNQKVIDGFQYNIDKHLFPNLNMIKNLEDMYQYYVDHDQFFDAAVSAQLLKLDTTRELLLKSLETSNVHFQRTIKMYAKKHKIDV